MAKGQDIQAQFDEGVNKGHFKKDGGSYELTEQGLAHGVDKLYGGQDLVNATAAMIEMIDKEGTVAFAAGAIPAKVLNSMITHSMLHAVIKKFASAFRDKDPDGWRQFVEGLENRYLEATDFYKRNPRAYSPSDNL